MGKGSLRYIVLALLVVVAVLGIRFVGAADDTFTGCLSAEGGLSKVAIGSAPTKPCSTKQTQVTWTSEPPAGPDGALGLEGQSCPDGEALEGFDENGGILCAVP
jgi:hypothetical protein